MKVDFFIVGAPKAGTTSLYYYLNEHPEIEMSSQKETDFFSDESLQRQGLYYGKNRIQTIEKYHSLFSEKQDKIYGEASVSYLFYKDVSEKIKRYNPKGKIIIMLRNPSDRAFSHYLMDYRLGITNETFESILLSEQEGKKMKLFYQQVIELGFYHKQVKRYLDAFGRDHVLIIFYDNFKKDVTKEVQKVYEFLAVDTSYLAEINKKYNTYTMPRNNWIRMIYSFISVRKGLNKVLPRKIVKNLKATLFSKANKPVLSDDLRLKLNNLYANDLKKLEELLNCDLIQWKK